MDINHRPINDFEIKLLENAGCRAENWNTVYVPADFHTDLIRDVEFRGEVILGGYAEALSLDEKSQAGIYHSVLQDCKIGDEVLISNVRLLKNYHVGNNCRIENVDTLKVDGQSTFGNGTKLDIVNESGGRELIIYDELSAYVAYLLVFYRQREVLISRLESMISEYVDSRRARVGALGKYTTITDTRSLINIKTGPYTRINGTDYLKNGTIKSHRDNPTEIGVGTIAKNFIISEGAKVFDNALLESCFVGQQVKVGKRFSGEHSAFFANSEFYHGESVSVFAGPYTVSHHTSNLLIAGLYSFFNAGSGTNQSNHMYKLGPVHQGILERGCKTGSYTYLTWPSRIGPFSTILGKHQTNLDTSNLPFSIIYEKREKSNIAPGKNLGSIGTFRDSQKWVERDKRADALKRDIINSNLFNPYVMEKIFQGLQLLKELSLKEGAEVKYGGGYITKNRIQQGIKYYQMAINHYIGNILADRVDKLLESSFGSNGGAEHRFEKHDFNDSQWIDLGGFIMPNAVIRRIMDMVEKGDLYDVDLLSDAFYNVSQEYDEYEWNWCLRLMKEQYGISQGELSPELIEQILVDWKESSLRMYRMIINDAKKEFNAKSQIGYGIDSGEEQKYQDFVRVRGDIQDDSIVRHLEEKIDEIERKAAKIIGNLPVGVPQI